MKKDCGKRLSLTLLILNTVFFIFLWILTFYGFHHGFEVAIKLGISADIVNMIMLKANLVLLPIFTVFLFKLYYGVRWLAKGRKRKEYIRFYLWSMTFSLSWLFLSVFIPLVMYETFDLSTVMGRIIFAKNILSPLISIIEILFLERYMRY